MEVINFDENTLINQSFKRNINHLYSLFYEDENAEVYIRKSISNYDMLNVLSKINELNSQYCGVTFLLADDMLVIKSYCRANGEIDILLREMVQNMKLAQKEE